MEHTLGWLHNTTKFSKNDIHLRSCTAADPPAMPVMVDFYKFFFSRDIRQAAKRKMHKIEAEQQQAEEFLRRIHAIHEADAAERSDIYSLERDAYKSITTEEHIRILDVQRALHVARHKEQMRLVESRRKQDAKIKIRLRLEEDQAAAAAAAQQREPPILYNSGVQGYGQVVLAGGGGGGVPVEEVEAAAPTPTPPLERRSSQAEVLKYSTRVRKKSAGSVGLQVCKGGRGGIFCIFGKKNDSNIRIGMVQHDLGAAALLPPRAWGGGAAQCAERVVWGGRCGGRVATEVPSA